MKNSIKVYCENREQFYSFTTSNNVTKWSNDILEACTFSSVKIANELIEEFKNSAMGDTKHIVIKLN